MRQKKNTVWGFIYILPLVGFVSVYLIYPLGFTVYHSFFEWNGFSPQKTYVGPKNYADFLLHDHMLVTILVNFVIFAFLTIFIQAFLGLILASILQVPVRFSNLYKTIIFAPAVLSPVIIGNVFFRILDPNVGLIAAGLKAVGLQTLIVQWLADPRTALVACAGVNIWQWTGYSMTMYVAGMTFIPKELYEAAKIDGANAIHAFFSITVPSLRSTHYMLLILGSISTLKQFDLIYTMTKGGPANATQFFSIYIFRQSFDLFRQGYASCIAIVMFLIALLLTMIFLRSYEQERA